MRGLQYGVLVLFWIIGISIIIVSLNVFPALKSGKAYDAIVKTEVYMMASAMDAATSYLNAALQYSNYQGCYDIAKRAGNAELGDANSITYEGSEYGYVPERQPFLGSLKDAMQANLNSYVGAGYLFARKYSVNLPAYTLTLAESNSNIAVTAAADGKISSNMDIKGAQIDENKWNLEGKVTLTKSADLTAKLRLNCMAIYDDMKSRADAIQNKIGGALVAELDRLAIGVKKDAGCDGVKSEAEQRIRASLDPGNSDIDQILELNMNMNLITPVEKGADGKFLCKFSKAGESGIAVSSSMTSAENVPVWNGKEIAYEPIKAVFAVKFAYSYPAAAAPTNDVNMGADTKDKQCTSASDCASNCVSDRLWSAQSCAMASPTDTTGICRASSGFCLQGSTCTNVQKDLVLAINGKFKINYATCASPSIDCENAIRIYDPSGGSVGFMYTSTSTGALKPLNLKDVMTVMPVFSGNELLDALTSIKASCGANKDMNILIVAHGLDGGGMLLYKSLIDKDWCNSHRQELAAASPFSGGGKLVITACSFADSQDGKDEAQCFADALKTDVYAAPCDIMICPLSGGCTLQEEGTQILKFSPKQAA